MHEKEAFYAWLHKKYVNDHTIRANSSTAHRNPPKSRRPQKYTSLIPFLRINCESSMKFKNPSKMISWVGWVTNSGCGMIISHVWLSVKTPGCIRIIRSQLTQMEGSSASPPVSVGKEI